MTFVASSAEEDAESGGRMDGSETGIEGTERAPSQTAALKMRLEANSY